MYVCKTIGIQTEREGEREVQIGIVTGLEMRHIGKEIVRQRQNEREKGADRQVDRGTETEIETHMSHRCLLPLAEMCILEQCLFFEMRY